MEIIIRYQDCNTPRSDGRKGNPTGLTVDKEYVVVGIPKYGQFSLVNDKGKTCNYSQRRFMVMAIGQ